jgi:hypothetical protein
VYCAEDIDNSWESNHFKDVAISRRGQVKEMSRVDDRTSEEYVALQTKSWTRSLPKWDAKQDGESPAIDACDEDFGEERDLVLVPYYFRANRDGKGHMRVGLLDRCH